LLASHRWLASLLARRLGSVPHLLRRHGGETVRLPGRVFDGLADASGIVSAPANETRQRLQQLRETVGGKIVLSRSKPSSVDFELHGGRKRTSPEKLPCQGKVEMSYSQQSRNVLF
jgi:hypothetical protein